MVILLCIMGRCEESESVALKAGNSKLLLG